MKIELIAVCAANAPGYWTRIMLPEHTRLATRFSDDAVTKATLLALKAAGTLEARRELAAEQSRLSKPLGGLGNRSQTRHGPPAFAATLMKNLRGLRHIIPVWFARLPRRHRRESI